MGVKTGAGGPEDPCDHTGSILWRMLVAANKPMFASLPRRQKSLLSKSIVNAVRLSQNPPGRFLQKDRRTKLWFDVGDQRAQEETARALREGEPQKDANTPTSVMDSALNAAATIQLAHSNATAKQQQQQQQAGVAAMASSSVVAAGGDSKIPARQSSTSQGGPQSRRASSTSLSSADAADAITSMRHLIDRSVITSSNTSGVASQRTSLEPVPLRGSFLSSAAALSIEPNPIPLPASSSSAGGSVAARASRMANQMMPPPRAMSAAVAMPAPAPLDVSMMQDASIMSRRISAPQLDAASAMNNVNNFMDPSLLSQEAPLKAPPPQYSSSTTKTKTAKTAAERDNSNNDQRRKSVHDNASTTTNNNADEPTIEELALLRILRP